MTYTIGNHDLITAENIMGYLQARRDELETDIATLERLLADYVPAPVRPDILRRRDLKEHRLREVHELLVHVEGDLDSTIKKMGVSYEEV